jgi:hypothetical protein
MTGIYIQPSVHEFYFDHVLQLQNKDSKNWYTNQPILLSTPFRKLKPVIANNRDLLPPTRRPHTTFPNGFLVIFDPVVAQKATKDFVNEGNADLRAKNPDSARKRSTVQEVKSLRPCLLCKTRICIVAITALAVADADLVKDDMV